jgi:hypothetical protein
MEEIRDNEKVEIAPNKISRLRAGSSAGMNA